MRGCESAVKYLQGDENEMRFEGNERGQSRPLPHVFALVFTSSRKEQAGALDLSRKAAAS